MVYKTYRSTGIVPRREANGIEIDGTISLLHDERYIRRKLLHFDNGDIIMLDLKQTTQLTEGDLLVTENREYFRISAAIEPLYEAKGKDALHLLELIWHLGNRHLTIEIFPDRIILLRDHVIYTMLEGLGASIREIDAPFQPLRGAYREPFHGRT